MSPTKKEETRILAGIRMLPSLRLRLIEQAKKEKRSLANLVEVACERYLEEIKGKKN